jgi:hypothetical protein
MHDDTRVTVEQPITAYPGMPPAPPQVIVHQDVKHPHRDPGYWNEDKAEQSIKDADKLAKNGEYKAAYEALSRIVMAFWNNSRYFRQLVRDERRAGTINLAIFACSIPVLLIILHFLPVGKGAW